MVLGARPKRSAAELYDQRIAEADGATLAARTESLHGKQHPKKLSPGGHRTHDRVMELWKVYLEKRVPELGETVVLLAEPVEGCDPPTESILKDFTRFMGLSIQGRLAEFATRKTIMCYLRAFSAAWRRRTYDYIPKLVRTKAFDYLTTDAFKDAAPLTTRTRHKDDADIGDVTVLIDEIYADTHYMRTTQSRFMTTYALLIAALSTERPGAIVEATDYRGTNEAILWGDHQFWVIPNDEDPYRPFLAIIVTIRNLKGLRLNDGANKMFFLLPEPDCYRIVDAFMYACVLGIMDGIFVDVSTLEEIFFPKHPCTIAHKLSIRPDKAKLPVVRKEMIIDGRWSVDHEFAMPYFMIAYRLRMLSLKAGFQRWMTFYCMRRGQANRLNHEVTEEERLQMMGHTTRSKVFQIAYLTRVSNVNLSAILAERMDNDATTTAAIGSMSCGRDTNAPLALDASEVTAIRSEPELVDLRSKKQETISKIADEQAKLDLISEEDEEAFEAQCAVVNNLRGDAKALERRHLALFTAEHRIRLIEKRDAYFAGASRRQLTGEEPPTRAPLAVISTNVSRPSSSTAIAAGKENGHVRRLPRLVSPIQEARTIIVNFTVDAPRYEHLLDSGNALLSIPSHPSPLCYPGEGPTKKNTCGVCNSDLSGKEHVFANSNTATHIHQCLLDDAQAKATAELDKAYAPQRCLWLKCKAKTAFATRDDFVQHVRAHIKSARNNRGPCLWVEEGQACRDSECSEEHFGRIHDINTWPMVRVEYDVPSAETFVDVDGTGDAWRERCYEHYTDLFHPFETRVDEDVDFSDHGVNFTVATENCINFDHGEGFSGARPEFHGHIERLVALAPAFCPCCVYNDQLPIEKRVRQFISTADFQLHLQLHQTQIATHNDPIPCPVPSCGPTTFGPLELLTHLIVYHRVPICGSTKHTSYRQLRLPSPQHLITAEVEPPVVVGKRSREDEEQVPPVEPPVLRKRSRVRMVIEDSDDEEQEPVASKRTDSQAGPSERGKGSDEEPFAGDSQVEAGPSERSKGKRRAQDDDQTSDNEEPAAPRKRRTGAAKKPKVEKTHYCTRHRLQLVDIRNHIPSACDATEFRIRHEDYTRTTWGPKYNLEEWLKTAPPHIPMVEETIKHKKKMVLSDELCRYKCAGCKKEFVSIAEHFNGLRSTTTKCGRKTFFVRGSDGKFGTTLTTLAMLSSAAAGPSTAGPSGAHDSEPE
uniref:C2H2-type domain-containing protein n=1 Tax=Mycena chlorophos TaxID=658473 RepID=A0ABQ0LZM5_MYCCL|nr:predicted protein [Mycena chlorophos]